MKLLFYFNNIDKQKLLDSVKKKFDYLSVDIETINKVMFWIKDYCHINLSQETIGSLDPNNEQLLNDLVYDNVNKRIEALILSYFNLKTFSNEYQGITHGLISNTPYELTTPTGSENEYKDLISRTRADSMSIDGYQIKINQHELFRKVISYLDELNNSFYQMIYKFEAC